MSYFTSLKSKAYWLQNVHNSEPIIFTNTSGQGSDNSSTAAKVKRSICDKQSVVLLCLDVCTRGFFCCSVVTVITFFLYNNTEKFVEDSSWPECLMAYSHGASFDWHNQVSLKKCIVWTWQKKNARLSKNTVNSLAWGAISLEPPVNHHQSSYVLPKGSSVIPLMI